MQPKLLSFCLCNSFILISEPWVVSCQDIYINQRAPTSGVYNICTSAGHVSVFCDFYVNRGYTFISRADLGKLHTLSGLYTENDHAIIRILYRQNSEQHDVSIEQLSAYKHRYPLDFQLSNAVGYKRPLNYNLAPYIYVGFLPASFASIKSRFKPSVQGYRTAGVDVTFSNSDGNPNSYISFFANPRKRPDNLYYRRCCDNAMMREWITRAQLIPRNRYMPKEFYYMYEMHMGGGGGYLSTSHTSKIIEGAAIGLGFSVEEKSFN